MKETDEVKVRELRRAIDKPKLIKALLAHKFTIENLFLDDLLFNKGIWLAKFKVKERVKSGNCYVIKEFSCSLKMYTESVYNSPYLLAVKTSVDKDRTPFTGSEKLGFIKGNIF